MKYKLLIEKEENNASDKEKYDELIEMLESLVRFIQSKKEEDVSLKNTTFGIIGQTFGRIKLTEIS